MARVALRVILLATLAPCALCQHEPAEEVFRDGVHFYEQGDYQAAHDAFSSCLQLSPTRLDCMTNLASVLIDLGGDEKAIAAEELYRAVLAVEPEHIDAATK